MAKFAYLQRPGNAKAIRVLQSSLTRSSQGPLAFVLVDVDNLDPGNTEKRPN